MSFSGAAFSVLYSTSLAVMASMMSPPQVSLVLPGMSAFCGVQPATTTSPPAWPAGSSAPGSGAVPPPPHAVATRARDVMATATIPRVLPRIRCPPPLCPSVGAFNLTWGSVGATHGNEAVLGHQTNTHKSCCLLVGNTQQDCDRLRDQGQGRLHHRLMSDLQVVPISDGDRVAGADDDWGTDDRGHDHR